VKELEEQLASLTLEHEEEVASYSRLWDQLNSLGQQFHTFLTRPQYIVPFLQPGRLVKVRNIKYLNHCYGSGSGLEPDSVTLWIRIRIGYRGKKINWKLVWYRYFLVIFNFTTERYRYKIAITT
jgi:hypothetical protein